MTDEIQALDAELVALLDGTLPADEEVRLRARIAGDPALAERFSQMAMGGEAMRSAFASLPPTPPDLSAWLSAQPGPVATNVHVLPTREDRRATPVVRLLAALAATLLFGIAVGFTAASLIRPPQGEEHVEEGSPEEWREAVSQYLELYTADTLADLPTDPALRRRQLAALGQRLGLSLDPAALDLPGLEFRRGQMFDYEGKPLAQIAYLDESGEPVALCIVHDAQPDQALMTEERHGLGIAYWAKGGRGYLVAGRLAPDRLAALASDLERRL